MPDAETLAGLMAEIEGLLAGLLPGGIAAFRPPAAEAEVRRVEARTGRPWPEDLRRLYRLHDGEDRAAVFGVLLGLPFIPLAELERHWEGWDKIARDGDMTDVDEDCVSLPPDWIQEVYANSGWIPLGHDGSGNHLGVDLDPGPDGVSGQVINFGRDEETKYVIALSLLAFFQLVRDCLRDGRVRARTEDVGEVTQLELTGPHSDYILAALPQMDLPYGLPTQGAPPPSGGPSYPEWYAALSPEWQAIVAARVGGDATGFADLQRVTHLNLMRLPITDLHPIARFTGLRELNLGSTGVSDLSPLGACPQIKTLHLGDTPLTDLSPLAALSRLVYLSLHSGRVTDLRPLASLTALRSLNLEKTALTDLDQLALLPGLTGLDIGGNAFPSFAPLRQLAGLTRLSVTDTNLPDFGDVAALPALTRLVFYGVPAQDWDTLRPLTRLRDVTCPFAAFLRLKDLLPPRIGFGIYGEMTEAQEAIYHDYIMGGEA